MEDKLYWLFVGAGISIISCSCNDPISKCISDPNYVVIPCIHATLIAQYKHTLSVGVELWQ